MEIIFKLIIRIINKIFINYLFSLFLISLAFHFNFLDFETFCEKDDFNTQDNLIVIENNNTNMKDNNLNNNYKEIIIIISSFLIFNLFLFYFNYIPFETVVDPLDIFNNNLYSNLTNINLYKNSFSCSQDKIILNNLFNQIHKNNELINDLYDIINNK